MKKHWMFGVAVLVLLISLSGVTAQAQGMNAKLEIIPLYNFMSNGFGDARLGNHGYGLEVAYNINDNVGFMAAFSGNHGTTTPFSFGCDPTCSFNETQRQDFVTGTFGPIFYHHAGDFRMFSKALAGVSRGHWSARQTFPGSPGSFNEFGEKGTGFALRVGGGVDYRNTGRWGWRVIQLDYTFGNMNADGFDTCNGCTLETSHRAETINNVSVSTGFIWRFGGNQ